MSRVQCNRFVLDEEGLLGPSPRFVIWFHGCNRNCPGCIAVDWNTKRKPEFDLSVLTIVQTIEKYPLAEGITISGGEPAGEFAPDQEITRKELEEITGGVW